MVEKYEVQNITRGPISFEIFTPYKIPEGMPKHKRRKLIKGSAQNVIVPPAQIRDMVKVTGLSVEDLKNQPELNKILRGNVQRLRLLTDVEPPVEEPTEDPTPEPVVLAGAPPTSGPPVGEPKPDKYDSLGPKPDELMPKPVVPAGAPPAVATPAGGPPMGAPPAVMPKTEEPVVPGPVGAPPMGAPPLGKPPAGDPTRKIETKKK